MHSHVSNTATGSQVVTPTTTTAAAAWWPLANRLASVAFLTAIFIYYDGMPNVSYEVGSAVLVGAWCVGLRSVFRRFFPPPPDAAPADTFTLPIAGNANDAAKGSLREAPRVGRVVPIVEGTRNQRDEPGDRMRPAM